MKRGIAMEYQKKGYLTSYFKLFHLKDVQKIEEQGGLKNVIKNNGEEVKLKDMVKKGQLEEINLKDPELKELRYAIVENS